MSPAGWVRDIIDRRQFTDLATNPVFSTRDFRAVPERFRALVPEYIKDYVPLNRFCEAAPAVAALSWPG